MPSLDGLRIRFLCIPDVDKAIGGVKRIYRQVEHLVRNKVDAAVITESDGFRPSWFVSAQLFLLRMPINLEFSSLKLFWLFQKPT